MKSAGTEWIYEFPQRTWCFPKYREDSLFRTCSILNVCDVKLMQTRSCPIQRRPHFRPRSWLGGQAHRLPGKGLMLWSSPAVWRSGNSERPGPRGRCSAGGKGPADPSCVIDRVVECYKSEWRLAKNSSEIYRDCLEMRQTFSRFITLLTVLASRQKEP